MTELHWVLVALLVILVWFGLGRRLVTIENRTTDIWNELMAIDRDLRHHVFRKREPR